MGTDATPEGWDYRRVGECQDCGCEARLHRPKLTHLRIVLAPEVCARCAAKYDLAGVRQEAPTPGHPGVTYTLATPADRGSRNPSHTDPRSCKRGS